MNLSINVAHIFTRMALIVPLMQRISPCRTPVERRSSSTGIGRSVQPASEAPAEAVIAPRRRHQPETWSSKGSSRTEDGPVILGVRPTHVDVEVTAAGSVDSAPPCPLYCPDVPTICVSPVSPKNGGERNVALCGVGRGLIDPSPLPNRQGAADQERRPPVEITSARYRTNAKTSY